MKKHETESGKLSWSQSLQMCVRTDTNFRCEKSDSRFLDPRSKLHLVTRSARAPNAGKVYTKMGQ